MIVFLNCIVSSSGLVAGILSKNLRPDSAIKRKFKRTSNRKLSIHDIMVLDFLWTWKVANFVMLVQVGYAKKSSWWAYKAIRQLQKEKYIQSLPRGKYLDHEVFALTNLGFEVVLMDRDDIVEYRYRPHAPARDYFAICLQLGELWQSPWDKVFLTEQMLSSLKRSNFPKDYVKDNGHVPDGITTLSCCSKQITFGIEVDLNLKDRDRYQATFAYYEYLIDIRYVFWLVRNDWMLEKILQMHKEISFNQDDSFFLFIRLDDFKKDFWEAKIIHVGERISANFLSRAKRGLYNGGSVPLAYKVSGQRDGRLEVIPSEAETVRDIFKTFLTEGTLSSATKALNKKKIHLVRRKEGGGQPRTGIVMLETLYKMLTNPVYIGVRVYQENGKECSVKAQWEPIVNEEIFKRVGEILKKNKSRKKASPKRWPYLLSGMLHCQCGHRMSEKSAHGNGGKIAYYDHAWTAKIEGVTDQKSKRCNPQRVLAEKLEPIVWKAVKDFLLVPEFFTEILLEAKNQSEINTPKQNIDRKQN